jgi:hypothetical protein
MRTLTCLARSFSLHPVCKPNLRRTTVDGGRASLASSGLDRKPAHFGPYHQYSWKVGVGSVSPVPPRIAHPWTHLRRRVSQVRLRRLRPFLPQPRVYFIPRPGRCYSRTTCSPILRSPDGAEFPIQAEPSNNNKLASQGQAAYREKLPWPSVSCCESAPRFLPSPHNPLHLCPHVPRSPVPRTFPFAPRLNSTPLICLLCAQLLH